MQQKFRKNNQKSTKKLLYRGGDVRPQDDPRAVFAMQLGLPETPWCDDLNFGDNIR